MVIKCDPIDFRRDYPIYVPDGVNPITITESAYDRTMECYDLTMECYDLSMDKELQMSEHRAHHYGKYEKRPLRTIAPEELDSVTCPNCGDTGLVLETRLKAQELGTYSVAGTQMKISAGYVPVLTHACGFEEYPKVFK
jgi:hypothetical protein